MGPACPPSRDNITMPPNPKLSYFDASAETFPPAVIEELIRQEGRLLKHDPRRSIVKQVAFRGKSLIIKQPIDKDKRLWIRILTLLRDSEAIRSLKSMTILKQHGITTNTPLACLEYTWLGMTVSSYMIYEYIEGEAATQEDSQAILALIKQIHATGYLHGDTQMRNFLKHQGEILTIDCKLKPKLWGPISENLEYIRLGRRNETAQKYINKSTASYKTALISHRLANLRGEVKNRIKNILTLG